MDFLDAPGSTRGTRLISLLKRENVQLVVLNHMPQQSPKLEASVVRQIRALYPNGERVDDFEVRWLSGVSTS